MRDLGSNTDSDITSQAYFPSSVVSYEKGGNKIGVTIPTLRSCYENYFI